MSYVVDVPVSLAPAPPPDGRVGVTVNVTFLPSSQIFTDFDLPATRWAAAPPAAPFPRCLPIPTTTGNALKIQARRTVEATVTARYSLALPVPRSPPPATTKHPSFPSRRAWSLSFYATVPATQGIAPDPSATLSDTYSTAPRLAQLRLPPGPYFVQLTDSLTPSLPALEISQLQVGERWRCCVRTPRRGKGCVC